MAKTIMRLLIAASLALPAEAFAQGCVMCREAAAASPWAAGFNIAILLLLAPAALLFAAIIGLLYYYGQRADAEEMAPFPQEIFSDRPPALDRDR